MARQPNPSLRELLAAPVALRVGDVELMIKPMGWFQAATALEYLLPAAGALPLLVSGDASREQRVSQWTGAAVSFREEIAAFCAEASALPLDDVKALPPAAMIELLIGLVEINLDFFVRSLPGLADRARGRLAAVAQRLEPALEQMAAGAGSTTSSSA